MKYKGYVTSVKTGLEVNAGDETVPIMAVVDVGWYYDGSVTFTCPVADAPRVGDTYIVEVIKLDFPPQS